MSASISPAKSSTATSGPDWKSPLAEHLQEWKPSDMTCVEFENEYLLPLFELIERHKGMSFQVPNGAEGMQVELIIGAREFFRSRPRLVPAA